METELLMDEVGSVIIENGGEYKSRVSDGEYNSLRASGKRRPRNILKVWAESVFLHFIWCIESSL